ncbi:thiamine diphosphokinase [Sediminibacillus albus]|uniref:Thiamine diphosphokinase n=1 Tax=Sediminibacillus albus TaxID=407036 RepID=A0A1G8W4E6_9BACI|nr:thiamine diphosphokinase [Sediminibacillus albus]SDJ73231.1 thiamine pyrophosphokinase [Sediminibacillus albus]
MGVTAIVGGGPEKYIPYLHAYKEVDFWIGADRGALTLINHGITPDLALGDFDSISEEEKKRIKTIAKDFREFPEEKDETDLELAVLEAFKTKNRLFLLFGVTGGRIDHSLANIQLLYKLKQQQIEGMIIDKGNKLALSFPGSNEISRDDEYPYISFLPFTRKVTGITLDGFYYKLTNKTINWGSTLCMSNELLLEKGTFSFAEGILLVIKSRDVLIEE